MKYVLNSESPCRFVIFPSFMNHSDICGNWTSAGFIKFYEKDGSVKIHCYGKSTSLGLSSDEEDTTIIQRQLSEY